MAAGGLPGTAFDSHYYVFVVFLFAGTVLAPAGAAGRFAGDAGEGHPRFGGRGLVAALGLGSAHLPARTLCLGDARFDCWGGLVVHSAGWCARAVSGKAGIHGVAGLLRSCVPVSRS